MALSDLYQGYTCKPTPNSIVRSILKDDVKYKSLNDLFTYIESKCEGLTKEEVYEVKIVVVLKELLNEKLVYNDVLFIITNLESYLDRFNIDISETVTNWYYYGNDFFQHKEICKLHQILGTDRLSYLAIDNDFIFNTHFEFVSLEYYLEELGLEDEIYLEDILINYLDIGSIFGDDSESGFLSDFVAKKFVSRILDSVEYCCDYYLGETASIFIKLDHSVYEYFWSSDFLDKYKNELLYVINCLIDVLNDNNIDFLVRNGTLLEVHKSSFSEDLDFKSILLLHLYKKCPNKRDVIMNNLDDSVKDYFLSRVPINDTSLYN